MTTHHLMLFLHVAGVTVWVGGMAFAWLCLRPATAALAPALRLTLWASVLTRFFGLVWVSIAAILLSGLYMLLEIGFDRAPPAWHLMLLSGSVMIVIYMSIWFGPWRTLQAGVAGERWAEAAVAMATIRQRVGINLVLGALTIAVATLGLGF